MDSRNLEPNNRIFAVVGASAAEGMGFWATVPPRRVSHLRLLQRISSDLFQPLPDKQKSEMKQRVLEGWWGPGGSLLYSC